MEKYGRKYKNSKQPILSRRLIPVSEILRDTHTSTPEI
jgi:hypothetical protein